MRFNFNHLYYFHVVATEGSLARASKRLELAQSTISAQIRQLEQSLDAELFQRTADGMRLTGVGRQVFQHTSIMFRAGERLEALFDTDEHLTRKSFVLGIDSAVSSSMAASFLVPILKLEHAFPRIFHSPGDALMRLLLTDEIDLALLHQPPPFSDERNIRARVVYRPSLWGIARKDCVTPGEQALGRLPLLHFPPSSPYRWYAETYLREQGLEPEILGEVEDAELMLAAVMQGICAAFVPASVVRAARLEDQLERLALIQDIETRIYAVYREISTSNTVLEAIDALLESYQPEE